MMKAVRTIALGVAATLLGCVTGTGLPGEPPAGTAKEAETEAPLVARWPLDTITPAGTTPDASGDGHDGTVAGASLVPGKIGQALQLGSGAYVEVPDAPALEPETLSVEAWVKADGATMGALSYVLGKGAHGCDSASYALYTGSSRGIEFYVTTASGVVFSPHVGVEIWDDQWHHVAGTYDGAFVRLYVDGAEVGSGTPASASIAYASENVTHDLFLGRYGAGCTYPFAGAVDEVRVWGGALTAEQIAEDAGSLVARWPLDTITPAGKTPDVSGDGLDGTVAGASLVPGKIDQALQLGSGAYVEVPDAPVLEPATLSVEAWVKADGAVMGPLAYVLGKGAHGCESASYALYTGSSSGMEFYITTASGVVFSPHVGMEIWDDQWHHVAGTYDGASVRLYVDGAEVGSGTPASASIAYAAEDVTHDLFLGRYGAGCTYAFPGALDEVRVWDRPLTAAEVAAHASE